MKIETLELLTHDISGTISFYEGLLGFEKLIEEKDRVSFRAGESLLVFLKKDNRPHHYHFAFDIPNNKVGEAKNWLGKKTSLIINPDKEVINRFESWNAGAFYFYDNNGNILEFITRYDLKANSYKPFSSQSLLYISEAGIVTEQPLQLATQLINENNLTYYSKGPKREDFVVVGDETGLLIIAKEGRNWFPTENKAEKQYLKATFISENVTNEIIIN